MLYKDSLGYNIYGRRSYDILYKGQLLKTQLLEQGIEIMIAKGIAPTESIL